MSVSPQILYLSGILMALAQTLIALTHSLIALAHTLIALAHTLIELAHTLIALAHLNSTEKMHRLYFNNRVIHHLLHADFTRSTMPLTIVYRTADIYPSCGRAQ